MNKQVEVLGVGADAAWAALCERTPGTTRSPAEAIEWKQAVEQILIDALPPIYKHFCERLLSAEAIDAAVAVAAETNAAGEVVSDEIDFEKAIKAAALQATSIPEVDRG